MAEKQLNKQQLEAISHKSGPLLIIAGAGTGKTTVVTERVKWLIAENLAQPSEILALTFTEKAAREMEERIDIALPYGYTQMWVMTFHSFCDRILRDEGLSIGLDTGYKLMTEADSVDLLRRHLFDLDLVLYRPLGNPHKFVSALLQHFSRLQDEDVTPEDYLKHTKNELSQGYKKYTELKIAESLLDFGDLISYSLKLFRTRPQILSKYQSKFKYILVDEFQDTNYAQNQLVNLLAGKDQNLTVVADDDQAIYRWRGAAISNVIQFRKTYPKAKLVTLVQNYRSTQEILDRAYDLIQFNNPDRLEIAEKIDKKLISARKIAGNKIEFLHADRVENEAEAVAKKIKEILEIGNLALKDFAILVRANAHADPFVRALSRHDIPYQFLGPGKLFQQPEVKDLVAYLKVLYNFTDTPSFYRLISMEFFNIPIRELVLLSNTAKRQNISLFEAAETSQLESVKNLVGLISKHLEASRTDTAGQILYDFLQATGILQAMLDYKDPITPAQAQNISRFFAKIKSFESTHEEASVRAVVDWLDLSMELGESPLATDSDWTQNDSVNILTIHSAKGLEFPVVFLVNLVGQRFPTTERKEPIPIPDELIKEILPTGDFHLQEERRLFYVGMTRARDRLFLTAADFYAEAKREKKLSPFISEALGSTINYEPITNNQQLSILDYQPSSVSRPTMNNEPTTINYLSYSQIQTFLDCPLHYKAKYILKLPTAPSAALSFGIAIHGSLKDIFSISTKDPTAILKKNWIPDGYLSKKHEQEYFAKGERILTHFLKNEYDPKHQPRLLEEMFTVPLNPMLKIGGKIDRVDVLPNGQIEIIDYKTGTIPKDREKSAIDDLQLSFYSLAATILKTDPFNKKPQDIKLTLLYLEEDKRFSTTRTAAQLDAAKQQILEYADQISHSDFKCTGKNCTNCDFKILCDPVKTTS